MRNRKNDGSVREHAIDAINKDANSAREDQARAERVAAAKRDAKDLAIAMLKVKVEKPSQKALDAARPGINATKKAHDIEQEKLNRRLTYDKNRKEQGALNKLGINARPASARNAPPQPDSSNEEKNGSLTPTGKK